MAIKYMARGAVAQNDNNAARLGQFTYISKTGDRWYQWDGVHKVAFFDTADEALAAATECQGPWFNSPEPGTVKAIPIGDDDARDPPLRQP